MSWIMAGRSNTFLMTNGKFGSIWEPDEVKKIKIFNTHGEAWEVAKGKGSELVLWSRWVNEIAESIHEKIEKSKELEKESYDTGIWQEYPKGLVWKQKDNAYDLDLLTFEIFRPKRRLVSHLGLVLKIEGETDEVPCFHSYEEWDIELVQRAYEMVEGGEA